ncbi:hypothetical protein [Noviherbaspirillum aridicola]|uniref:Uncharacterized protein n=1 Tax=Noviherbaspirillum aridicola TaxID=2849687 RepID=A0ABQ4Q9P2_9BURK|nr:hypothetical protein [Noviherbaspirillum aridicola]GIZ53878.1 hypothetical protein NCCP691_38920 [Noviherbaspirillum aridicola]
MTPEEIVAEINTRNREALDACDSMERLTRDQVLTLMDNAAMQGFRMGSNVALSMVKGALLVQVSRSGGVRRNANSDFP